jgi:uncharacterized protein DUF4349/putative zinc finger protein
MDRSVQHAFDAEEIMAYLDGELEPQRAAALAAHLVNCGECQEVAQGFRAVSERVLSLEVEAASPRVSDAVLDSAKAAVAKIPASASKMKWWHRRRLFARPFVWALASCVAVALIVYASIPNLLRSRVAAELAAQRATGLSGPLDDKQLGRAELSYEPGPGLTEPASQPTQNRLKSSDTEAFVVPSPAPPPTDADSNGRDRGIGYGKPLGGEFQAPEAVGPMIAQTASVSIVATNYDEASAAIDRLAAAHGGYVEKLDAKAQTGSARELSATLRIPAKQLEGFLADLRKLGHVEEESRGNEEVSAQYVDLQARLKAARATEQRLIELLGSRTGKLSDVLEAERELARVRGEIESMQGESAVLVHRVSYATVQVELSEVYHERLTVDSKGTKLRNALVEGLSNVEDGAVSLLLFLLAFGPSILFWLAVLLVPAWLLWRRFRRRAQA